MNHYGISAIHWDMILGEIDQVLLHKVVRDERNGMISLRHGERVWSEDVARLIRGGDKVWVMQSAGRDRYRNTDHVGVRRGRRAYLYSHKKDGTPTNALTDLPRYERPDDSLASAIWADSQYPLPMPPWL
jgi:hypothetical protein